jgi:transposase InsO family protein
VNVYPFIEAEKVAGRNVKRACELLGVSRSAYYQHRCADPTRRQLQDDELTVHIRAIHAQSRGSYGSPRVHEALKQQGREHGRKRIARLMSELNLCGKAPRSWKKTTIADPLAASRPDLVGRDFTADASHINERWCGDITYIRTWQGWLFLATVIDIASRKVVGWAIADHLRAELISDALSNALATRRPPAGLIFHSDRGCQYTSAAFAELARAEQVRLSVGRTGQCWDNALAESFFASLKTECLDTRSWPTHDQARQAVVDYISWFNGSRLHSTLGYLSPNDYETTAHPNHLTQAIA